MKLSEVAKYLRTSSTTIYRLLKANQLPAFRVGADWRFRRNEIDRWRLEPPRAAAASGQRRQQ